MKKILDFFGFSKKEEEKQGDQFEIQMFELQDQINQLKEENQKKDYKLLILQEALMQKNLQLIQLQKYEQTNKIISKPKKILINFNFPILIGCDEAFPEIKLQKKQLKALEKAYESFELCDKLNNRRSKNIYDIVKILNGHTKIENQFIEQYLFEKIYKKVFNQDEDTQARGIQIFEKLQVLQNIVTPELLGVDIRFNIPSIINFLQNDLSEESHTNQLNADQLFPVIVYIILLSNPPELAANLAFIDNFINKIELYGEYGYLLTTLSAAASFLERIDGNALNQGRLEIGTMRYNFIEYDDYVSTQEEQKEELYTIEKEEEQNRNRVQELQQFN